MLAEMVHGQEQLRDHDAKDAKEAIEAHNEGVRARDRSREVRAKARQALNKETEIMRVARSIGKELKYPKKKGWFVKCGGICCKQFALKEVGLCWECLRKKIAELSDELATLNNTVEFRFNHNKYRKNPDFMKDQVKLKARVVSMEQEYARCSRFFSYY